MDVGLPHIYSGKVRDIYDAGDDRLLLVASDRVSAFDVIMAETIPDKGRVLTALSSFWFETFQSVVPSHLLSVDVAEVDGLTPEAAQAMAGRVMLCRRAEMLPIECIVRGYLSGSAWREYRDHGTMHGQELAAGLVESDQLAEPVFTPSTKAAEGHDENISFAAACDLVGVELAERARDLSLEIYRRGAALAAERGIIVADTKFELGLIDGELVLADEVMTPDSSRFWPADDYAPGRSQVSYDKQPIRDFLDASDWDKQPPPPPLPAEVVTASAERYRQAYERISQRDLDGWAGGPSVGE